MPTEIDDGSALRKVKRHFWTAAALSIPVVLIAMLATSCSICICTLGAERRVARSGALLTLPVVAWAGADYYRRGWLGVVNRSPNMYTLIGLGVLVAYAYSLFATFAPAAPSRPRCAMRTAWSVSISKSPP